MTDVTIGDILPYTQALATGGQTVFGTNWTANAASDVVVYYTPTGTPADDATQQLMSSEFSVAFIGGSEEVQVTLVTPANLGDIVTITRQTPADYLNLYSNTNFTPSMLNNDFGVLTLVDQQAQLVNQLIAPRYNYSSEITDVIDTILPILGANQTWAKNAANTAIVPVTLSGSGGISGTINIGSPNQLAFYQSSGNTISGLPTGNNSVLVTNGSGVPSLSTTLPNGLALGTPASGIATNLTGTASGLTAGHANAVALSGITGLGTGVATALAINTGLSGAIVTLGHSFYVNTSSTDITAGVTIVYSNVVKDSASAYNASNGHYTIPTTGWWIISGGYVTNSYTPGAGGISQINIMQNSTQLITQVADTENGTTASAAFSVSMPCYLTATDVITIKGTSNIGGGGGTTLNTVVANYFSGVYLHP